MTTTRRPSSTIVGTSGSTAYDANSDAAAIGSDGQQYSYASIVSLPTFSYGEFHVSPGVTVKGWVAFELPPGVTVASVQWAPSLTGIGRHLDGRQLGEPGTPGRTLPG